MTEFEAPDEELVASTPSQRNYKGILIALLVICAICGLILFAIYLLRPPDDGPRVKGRKVTLADTMSKHFVTKPFNGTWISDHEIRFRDSRGGISTLNTATLESKPFLSNTTFRQLNAKEYTVSPDQHYVLFIHDVRRIWEHSSMAKYTIYDIQNEFKLELNPPDEKSRDGLQSQLQHAEWGPEGNALVMVHKNDIYYKSSVNSTRTIRLTWTGELGVIFNGVPDWIYEVTILKSNKALWMNPNGRALLFASFNDSLVGEVTYPWYGETLTYPQLRKIRYPKAGTTNPEVTLWVANLGSNDALRPALIKLPPGVDSRNHYLVNVQWITNEEFSTVFVNREQTTAVFAICNARNLNCKTFYTLSPPGINWLDFPEAPLFSTSREKCLLRIPLREGDVGYFHQVVLLELKSGKEVPVTNGPLQVTQISAWDQFNQTIYFIGVPPKKPGERHLYRVKESGDNNIPVCLTCTSLPVKNKSNKDAGKGSLQIDVLSRFPAVTVTEIHNNNQSNDSSDSTPIDVDYCLYNRVIFSPNQQMFVRECQGPGVPTYTLHSAPSGKMMFTLDANSAMHAQVGNIGLPLIKTFPVELRGGEQLATARLYLPAGFREGEEFRFPLVLHLTSGLPGSQMVDEKWKLTWASYLTSQKNFIVAEIDGRGSGYGADDIRQIPREDIGIVQVSDQLEVIKFLRDNLSFIDERNLAVWGRGYGGYLTLLTLANDVENLFKCGISVAPITKWEFYNSVYAERYFGSPNRTENAKAYEDGDIIQAVKDLLGKKFLLIHGTADEKVHYQHTLHLTKALIKEGVSFTEQVYPDEGHEFNGVKDHLYNTMESYFDSNFDIPDWEDWEKANFLGIKM